MDDQRPWVREVYVKACGDSRPALQVVEDHLGTDQVMISKRVQVQEGANEDCHR